MNKKDYSFYRLDVFSNYYLWLDSGMILLLSIKYFEDQVYKNWYRIAYNPLKMWADILFWIKKIL